MIIYEPEKAFQRIKAELPIAAVLLTLATILGGVDIPRLIFDRAVKPRRRWSDQGEIEEVSLDSNVIEGFEQVDEAIGYLCAAGIVNLESRGGYEILSLMPRLHQFLEQEVKDDAEVRVRALMLVCHSFPADKDLEPLHRDLGRIQLRPLQQATQSVKDLLNNGLLSTAQLELLISTLLESSKFPSPTEGSTQQFRAIQLAETALPHYPTNALQLLSALRQKALARLVHGKIYPSPPTLLSLTPANALENALQWELHLSHAHDLVIRDDYAGASAQISNFKSFNPAHSSTLELNLQKQIHFQSIRFSYLQGNFTQVREALERPSTESASYNRFSVNYLTLLAGCYCELHDANKGVLAVESALQNTELRTPRAPKDRQILEIFLAETKLCLATDGVVFDDYGTPVIGQIAIAALREAKTICERIRREYEQHPDFNLVEGEKDKIPKKDRMDYLRVVTISARVALLETIFLGGSIEKARKEWKDIWEAIKRCEWEEEGFMVQIYRHTVSAMALWFGDEELASVEEFEHTRRWLGESKGRFFIVGLSQGWVRLLGEVVKRRKIVGREREM